MYKFSNWKEQGEYNKKSEPKNRLYTRNQLRKYFHKKPLDDSEYELINMDFTLIINKQEVQVSQCCKFYTIDQTRDIGECAIGQLDKYRKEHNIYEYTNIFDGKQVVFTGIMERPRKEMIEIAEKFGASTSDRVTKKTNILVVGIKAGSKLEKAKQYGIEIINEKDFWELVE